MQTLWSAKTEIDDIAKKLNSSLYMDFRLIEEDIKGSIAHVKMLFSKNIISESDENLLCTSLSALLEDVKSGRVKISDIDAEDVHSFVELYLTDKIGDTAKKIHTARSRNDQVALDMRLYLKKEIIHIIDDVIEMINVFVNVAQKNIKVIMPGFTHLQHAQPVLFSHYILSYCFMFKRDIDRFLLSLLHTDVSVIGSCALAGTGFDIDRQFECRELHLGEVCLNSMDGVSDRDFAIDFLSAAAQLSMHLSRMCEEIIIFSSTEYSYITISEQFSTGSSIMPQKKNADIAEIVRSKSATVYGNLLSMLVLFKALPLSYNKDMQDDKKFVFDTVDTLKLILPSFYKMVETIKVNKDKMRQSAELGYLNATDVADYLVKKGIPFRDAYKISSQIVFYAQGLSVKLSDLKLSDFKSFSPLFDDDILSFIDIENCVNRRKSEGGTSAISVKKEIRELKRYVKKIKKKQEMRHECLV